VTITRDPPVGILESFKAFLLWIGGSLAGITALLYACGYLVTRAHMSMLGLHGLVEYGNDHFLQEGAKFVLAAGYDVLRVSVTFVVMAGAVILVVLIARRLFHDTSLTKKLAALRLGWLGNWWRHGLYVVLFLALIWHTDFYINAFERPLSIANLLYVDPARAAPAEPGSATELAGWILAGDARQLARHFEHLLFGSVAAAALAFFAWRVVAKWRLRAWLVAPFVLPLAIYVVTLPMAYGVMQRPVRYPLVTFAGYESESEGRLFLLMRAGDAFVVWNEGARRVVWLPSGGVKRAEVRGVGDLFSGRTPGPPVAKEKR
jgi:hypothetical protein